MKFKDQGRMEDIVQSSRSCIATFMAWRPRHGGLVVDVREKEREGITEASLLFSDWTKRHPVSNSHCYKCTRCTTKLFLDAEVHPIVFGGKFNMYTNHSHWSDLIMCFIHCSNRRHCGLLSSCPE
jgi:hypothetical protein